MSPAPLVLLPLLCGLAAGQQVPPDVPAEAPPAAAAPEAPGTPVAPVPANPVEPAPAGRVLDAIPWQRSLDDALALSRQTGKPMLLCVNMDGEPASERLANHRYKDPGFIALTAGFIPLIVSPDRHNSRDHDDEGRRIPDARFGRVVDGEHIALEPLLYELYFRGTRVAPRHVGVSPEGEILFDLYLLDNLAHIDRRLAEHGRFDTALPDPTTLDLSGLLRSPDAAARELLETHYASADRETRTALVTASLDPGLATRHPELLRMGLRDRSGLVQRATLTALLARPDALPLELATEALRVAQEHDADTAPLAEGLAALAERSGDAEQAARALRLARLLAALGEESQLIDTELWQLALTGRPVVEPAVETADFATLYAAVGRIEELLDGAPDDPALLTALAQAALRAGESLIGTGSADTGYLLADAQTAAQAATDADPDSVFAWATLARASHVVGESELAVSAAERALPGMLVVAASARAADVLEAFVNGRATALLAALEAGDEWPATWLADVVAAYEVLAAHPHGNADRIASGLDVLAALELHEAHGRLARVAIERHPVAPRLHDHYRWHVLRDRGAASLPGAYEGFEVEDDVLPTWLWFDGFARLIAADHLREGRAAGPALAVYERSIESFHRSVELEPAFGNARDFVGLAQAGMAAVYLDEGEYGKAAAAIKQAAQSSVVSFRLPDALGVTPTETVQRMARELRRAGLTGLEADLAAALRDKGVEVHRW